MRGWMVVGCLLLSGCDAITRRPNPSVCTRLADEKTIKNWKDDAITYDPTKGTPPSVFEARSYLLTDCLITHARQFETETEVSSVVARGTAAACQTETSDYNAGFLATHGMDVMRIDSPDDLQQMMGEIDVIQPKILKSVSDTALRYVMEARAGHCAIDRRPPQSDTVFPTMPDIVI